MHNTCLDSLHTSEEDMICTIHYGIIITSMEHACSVINMLHML